MTVIIGSKQPDKNAKVKKKSKKMKERELPKECLAILKKLEQ